MAEAAARNATERIAGRGADAVEVVARRDQARAQREPHQHVVGTDLPVLGIRDLEPAPPLADLRQQLRLLRQRVGVGLEGGRGDPAGRRPRPASPAHSSRAAASPLTRAGARRRDRARAPRGVGVRRPSRRRSETIRDVGARGLAQRRGRQQLRAPARRRQADRPHQRAALERPLAVDEVTIPIAGAMVDGTEEGRGVGIGDVREIGRLVGAEQLAHTDDDQALERGRLCRRHEPDATRRSGRMVGRCRASRTRSRSAGCASAGRPPSPGW